MPLLASISLSMIAPLEFVSTAKQHNNFLLCRLFGAGSFLAGLTVNHVFFSKLSSLCFYFFKSLNTALAVCFPNVPSSQCLYAALRVLNPQVVMFGWSSVLYAMRPPQSGSHGTRDTPAFIENSSKVMCSSP